MIHIYHLISTFRSLIPIPVVCVLWDIIWKVIGMWKAGRNNDLVWFICIAVFNTVGILPIIYILFTKNNPDSTPTTE